MGGCQARYVGPDMLRLRPVLVTRRLELPVRGLSGRWKYRALADHYVAIDDRRRSRDEIIALLKERTRRIPEPELAAVQ